MDKKLKTVRFKKDEKSKSYFDLLKLQDLLSLSPADHSQFENHKLAFFALIFVSRGKGKHSINFADYSYEKGTILAIGSNSIHKFYKSDANGYVLVFTADFVLQYLNKKNAEKMFRLFNEQLASPKQQLNESDFEVISKHLNSIQEEFLNIKDDYSQEVIRSLLHIVITHLIRIKSKENTNLHETKYLNQFLKFQALVDEHAEEHKNVSEYADIMCVTSRTLNNITQNIINRSAKALIDDTLTNKIKQYLINSEMNISQIAYQTGFRDPSHLSKFLHRHTGYSPREFRQLF